jgi:hypothetical protein
VARGKALYACICGAAPFKRQAGEIVGDPGFVGLSRHVRQREKSLYLGSEPEAGGAGVIVERLHPEMVACAEEPATPAIPNREREISQKLFGAGFAPPLIGRKDKLLVGRRAGGESQALR